MKLLRNKAILLGLSFLLFAGMKCKKENTLQPTKEELPAATQTGANTFGFLLNGEVWLPKVTLLNQKLDLSYDPNYKGGTLNILAKRIISEQNINHYFAIGNDGISNLGTYSLYVYFHDNYKGCEYIVDKSKPVGLITINKIDLTNKFISGTFEFKLEKSGCPTINATQGRFDLKIE